MNIRVVIGQEGWSFPVDNSVDNIQHCHTTPVNVTVPVIADYPCDKPIFGQVVYIDAALPNGLNEYGFYIAEISIYSLIDGLDVVSEFAVCVCVCVCAG